MSGIKEIPNGFDSPWAITINGAQVGGFNLLKCAHPHMGTLAFGLRPEGTVGWMWEESLGGVGIIPYITDMPRGKLYVGLIKQVRPVQGGETWQIPRGFKTAGKTHLESAVAETTEEIGSGLSGIGQRLNELPGDPVNPNSTFFDTSNGNGFHYFALPVQKSELERYLDHWRFRNGIFQPNAESEKILACEFFHWQFALGVTDNYTVAAVGRLISFLVSAGRFRP